MPPNRWPDEPLPSGTPYADLPISNPNCMNDSCNAFAAGWNESYRDTSLRSQLDYGFWTLCYYLSWGVLFSFANLIYLLRDYHAQRWTRRQPQAHSCSWRNRMVAYYRSVVYRRFTGRLKALPSFGILALLALSTVFFICLIFPEQQYLRSRFRFGSPPLSVRCALTISALMPLLIALGGKVNIVTLLTGICYTKLNILHRYVGGVIFALATIHAIPHIYAPIKDGGFDYLAQLYIDQKRELSGTILYFLFLWLIALSIPWFRRAFYEIFVYTHIFLGLSFIGILAWHIKGEYMAPVYMYVTLGILLLQTMLRLLMSIRSLLFLSGYPTTLEPLPGSVTKVRVSVPAALCWHPGDHAFIRMPALSVLDNHPFTIASVPSSSSSTTTNTLTFLIRTHAGFTSRLAALAASKAAASQASSDEHLASSYRSSLSSIESAASSSSSTSTSSSQSARDHDDHHHRHQQKQKQQPLRTLIDGPHSRGARVPSLHVTADTVVLVAGGTGITAAVPWLVELARRMAHSRAAGAASECRVAVVRLVWVVRRAECVEWIREEVADMMAMMAEAGSGGGRVVVDVYVTGGSGNGSSESEVEVVENREEEEEEEEEEKKDEEEEEGGDGDAGGVVVAGESTAGNRGDQSDGGAIPAPPPQAYGVADRGDDERRLGAPAEGLGTVEVEERGGLVVHYERPVIARVLPSLMSGTRAFVLGCGPEGLKVELSNAVAKMQLEMVVKSKTMESIALHTEMFGW